MVKSKDGQGCIKTLIDFVNIDAGVLPASSRLVAISRCFRCIALYVCADRYCPCDIGFPVLSDISRSYLLLSISHFSLGALIGSSQHIGSDSLSRKRLWSSICPSYLCATVCLVSNVHECALLLFCTVCLAFLQAQLLVFQSWPVGLQVHVSLLSFLPVPAKLLLYVHFPYTNATYPYFIKVLQYFKPSWIYL